MSIGYFECRHCNKKFVSENNFQKHTCEEKERFDFVTKNISGKRAFIYYKHWQSIKNRTAMVETFISSRYYNSFCSLVDFIEQKALPSPMKYIEYCESRTLLPTMWKRGDIYLSYMKIYDSLVDPVDQVEFSIKTLKKLSEQIGCKLSEVFTYLYGGEVLKLLTTRQLSPFFVQFSKTYKSFVASLDEHEKISLSATFDSVTVFTQITNSPKNLNSIELLIKTHEL